VQGAVLLCKRRFLEKSKLPAGQHYVIAFKQTHYLYKSHFVGIVHRCNGNAVFFTRCGMDKFKFAAVVTVHNAYMAYTVAIGGACEYHDVAGPGVVISNFFAYINKLT